LNIRWGLSRDGRSGGHSRCPDRTQRHRSCTAATPSADAGSCRPASPCGVSVDIWVPRTGIDVVIDFSRAEAVAATADACTPQAWCVDVGTTGLDAATQARLTAASECPCWVSQHHGAEHVFLQSGGARCLPARQLRHRDFRSAPSPQGGCASGNCVWAKRPLDEVSSARRPNLTGHSSVRRWHRLSVVRGRRRGRRARRSSARANSCALTRCSY
jgi:hypothetical protein